MKTTYDHHKVHPEARIDGLERAKSLDNWRPSRFLQPGESPSALLFEGGGTKGNAYVGVIQVLEEHGLLKGIKRFAGTSAGSQTAAILAVGLTSKEIEENFAKAEVSHNLLDMDLFPCYPGKQSLVSCCWKGVGNANDCCNTPAQCCCGPCNICCHWAAFKGAYLEWSLDEMFAEKMRALEREGKVPPRKQKANSSWRKLTLQELYDYRQVEFKAGVVELNSGEFKLLSHEDYPHMPVSLAARASSTLPSVFRPVHYKRTVNGTAIKELFVDGALAGNLPITAFKALDEKQPVLGFNLFGKSEYADTRKAPIATFGAYLGALMNAMMENANAAHGQGAMRYAISEGGNKIDLVHIDVGDALLLNIGMTDAQRAEMANRGREAAEWYLSEFTGPGGEPTSEKSITVQPSSSSSSNTEHQAAATR